MRWLGEGSVQDSWLDLLDESASQVPSAFVPLTLTAIQGERDFPAPRFDPRSCLVWRHFGKSTSRLTLALIDVLWMVLALPVALLGGLVAVGPGHFAARGAGVRCVRSNCEKARGGGPSSVRAVPASQAYPRSWAEDSRVLTGLAPVRLPDRHVRSPKLRVDLAKLIGRSCPVRAPPCLPKTDVLSVWTPKTSA